MDPFTVMRARGRVLFTDTSTPEKSPIHAGKWDDYDLSRGPSSSRARGPQDLTRSRRVGLSRTVCRVCWRPKDQGFCGHEPYCEAPNEWIRQTTGPMAANETSKDVGWR